MSTLNNFVTLSSYLKNIKNNNQQFQNHSLNQEQNFEQQINIQNGNFNTQQFEKFIEHNIPTNSSSLRQSIDSIPTQQDITKSQFFNNKQYDKLKELEKKNNDRESISQKIITTNYHQEIQKNSEKNIQKIKNSIILNDNQQQKFQSNYQQKNKFSNYKIIQERQLPKRLLGIKELDSHIVQQKTIMGQTKIIREKELEQIRHENLPRKSLIDSKPEIEICKKQKVIEIIKEVPKEIKKIVDVPYDVVIDIPIERIIEKEKITEILIEKPIEKLIEIPIEQIVEVPIEKIIEIPIENKIYREIFTEKLVEKPYDVIRENLIYKDNILDIDENEIDQIANKNNIEIQPTIIDYDYREKIIEKSIPFDNVIEKIIHIPVEKVIKIPKEKIIQKKKQIEIERPVPIEKIIEKIIEIPKPIPIYKEIEILIEKPKYIENIIEIPVPIEKFITKEIEIPREHIFEKPIYIDNIIEKKVEKLIEIPKIQEQIIEIPQQNIEENLIKVDQYQGIIKEKIIKRSVPRISIKKKNFEQNVEKYKKKEIDIQIPKPITNIIFHQKEIIIEAPVVISRTHEVPIEKEKIIEIPKEIISENIIYVEKIVEKPIHVDIIIEKKVEVIKEQIIEVPVEKIIEVPVNIYIDKPIINEKIIEYDFIVERNNYEITYEENDDGDDEREDENFNKKIAIMQQEEQQENKIKKKFQQQKQILEDELYRLKNDLNSKIDTENIDLIIRLAELQNQYENEQEKNIIYKNQIQNKNQIFETELLIDPKVQVLKSKLNNLLEENNKLINKIEEKSLRNIEELISENKFNQFSNLKI